MADNTNATDSIQRIQESLKRMADRSTVSADEGGALEGMLGRLSRLAREDTQRSEKYQRYAAKPNVTALLGEAMHDANSIAIAVSSVLRDKYGIQVDRTGYKVIKSISWHYEDIAEELKALGEGDWSSKALWDIERVLRESVPRTEPSKTTDLIRVNTAENSTEFTALVNTLAQKVWEDTDDAPEKAKLVLGALRGRPYPQTTKDSE